MPSVVPVSPSWTSPLTHGVLDLGAAEAERDDLGDVEAVDLGEAALAVGAARAVLGRAELDRLAERGEVGERLEVVLRRRTPG